jgi:exonuclease SbcD
MVRIAHIADAHLGTRCSYLGDKAIDREKDFLRSFERVVSICCDPENKIDALVIAGDLFDSFDPPSEIVGFVQKNISKLNRNRILAIAVPGTHDAYGYKNSIYRKNQLHGIHILCSPALDQPFVQELAGEKVFFYGMAYMPGTSKNPFESFTPVQEKGIHIGIIHGSVEAPLHWERRTQDLHMTAEDIAHSNLDYLALGHFHNFQENQYGRTMAVYPGSLEGKDFSECGHRYMVVVDFAGKTPRIEKIAVNSRAVKVIDLNINKYPYQSSEEIVTFIRRDYRDPESIVRLCITGSW